MEKITNSTLELIGNTPLIRLNRLPREGWATVLAKLETFNPTGSVKDRIALAMIEEAEEKGILHPGDTIVESTSGNTGIALAMIAAVKGYHLILTMPEDVIPERRRMLIRYGAELYLTPAIEGMAGAIAMAQRLADENPGCFTPKQFENPANPQAHRHTTAREILKVAGRELDAFVAGVGTGGTITGVGEVLKEAIPSIKIIAVEPAGSPLLSQGRVGEHRISGIGADFVPKVLNREIIDEIIPVADDSAYHTADRLTREEGLLVGPSSGANVFASLMVAERLGRGKVVVTMLPDTAERYLGFPF